MFKTERAEEMINEIRSMKNEEVESYVLKKQRQIISVRKTIFG